MEERKIYPVLVNKNKMADYYNMLMKEKFELKIFSKSKNADIYEYFLPVIRNFMFWTFDMKDVKGFAAYDDDMKASICDSQNCNIFIKGDSEVICFSTGVAFIMTKDQKVLDTLIKTEDKVTLEKINIRADRAYEYKNASTRKKAESEDKYKDAHLYAYILQLYKLVYLNRIDKEMHNSDAFDRVRDEFVSFSENVYDVQVTDKDTQIYDWVKDLELDRKYILVENKFDLLYKNNGLNNHAQTLKIFTVLAIVLIIIGCINLANWLGNA